MERRNTAAAAAARHADTQASSRAQPRRRKNSQEMPGVEHTHKCYSPIQGNNTESQTHVALCKVLVDHVDAACVRACDRACVACMHVQLASLLKRPLAHALQGRIHQGRRVTRSHRPISRPGTPGASPSAPQTPPSDAARKNLRVRHSTF